jgi:transmembrane sensor
MSYADDSFEQELPSASEQAAEWFVRMKEGQFTEVQRNEFERWLDADPNNRKEYQAVQGLWSELDGLKDIASFKHANVESNTSQKRSWNSLALAATLIIFVFTGVLVFLYDQGSYTTAKGELTTVRLEDSSVVHLNSDTSLKVDFTGGKRTIYLLRGEAYFDVSHDPQRPFVVESEGGSARAVGTQFNVYRQSSAVRVTVVEGRVEVATENGDARLLNADEVVAYKSGGREISQIEHSDGRSLDWLDGRLRFKATPLVDVVSRLNRYLETPLRISDPELNNLKLSGDFRISNLKDLPELLPRLLPVTLQRKRDYIQLHHSK